MQTDSQSILRRQLAFALLVSIPLTLWFPLDQSASAQCSCNRCFVPANAFKFSSYALQMTPRRILIVTALNRQDRLKEQDVFAESMARHLEANGNVNVIRSREYVCDHTSPFTVGHFDERQLVHFSNRYGVDAVLYCDLRNVLAYEPMSARANLVLVDCHDAVALASGSVTVNLNDAATAKSYDRVSKALVDFAQHKSLADVHRRSPTRFIDFAAKVVAAKLRQGLNL